MTNYRNIFTYKDVKYHSESYEDSNSEVIYQDCFILNNVKNVNAGDKVNKICIDYTLYGCNENGVVIYEEPLIDLGGSFNLESKHNFHNMFTYDFESNNYNLTNFEFYNCKMMIDAGDMKKDMHFEKIFVKIEIVTIK